jgi:hypothetical protein
MNSLPSITVQQFFLPVVAQVLLTLLVWLWMYYGRLSAIFESRVDIQALADEAVSDRIFKRAENASDNLENLFEIPVLFFTGICAIAILNLQDSLYLGIAWAFVVLRAFHSLVHCTSNSIRARFAFYVFSSFAVWILWIRLGITLIANGN